MLENNNGRKSFSTLEELLDDIFRKTSEENNTNSEYRNDYYNERRIDDEEYAKKELEKLSDFLIYKNINPMHSQNYPNENSILEDVSEKLEYSLENIEKYLFDIKYNTAFGGSYDNKCIQEMDDFKLKCISSVTSRLLDCISTLLIIESSGKISKSGKKNEKSVDDVMLLLYEMNNTKVIGETIHKYVENIERVMGSKYPLYVKRRVQYIAINNCTNIFKYLSERILK